MCVCACVCVCVGEGKRERVREREKERERERKRERESYERATAHLEHISDSYKPAKNGGTYPHTTNVVEP